MGSGLSKTQDLHKKPFVVSVLLFFPTLAMLFVTIFSQAPKTAGADALSLPLPFHPYLPGPTGSYHSQRFLSSVAGNLQAKGWNTEIQRYIAEPKAHSGKKIFGENLLGYKESLEKAEKLLIVPYDQKDGPHPEKEYGESLKFVTDLVLALASQENDGSLAIAFVSGHYQGGSGTLALLKAFSKDQLGLGRPRISQSLILFPVEPPGLRNNRVSIAAFDYFPARPIINVFTLAKDLNLPLSFERLSASRGRDLLAESLVLEEHNLGSRTFLLSQREVASAEKVDISDQVGIGKTGSLFEAILKNSQEKSGDDSKESHRLSYYTAITLFGQITFLPKALLSVAFLLCGFFFLALAFLPLKPSKKNRLPIP